MNEKQTLDETQIVLYRCPTPTNVLCPCGAVARRLEKLRLGHRVQRVPYRRAGRPEIEELTRQTRVPVLVDGDEVIYDSKRIVEYLDWKYRKDAEPAAPSARKTAGNEGKAEASGGDGLSRLYNLKRWRHRRRQSN
jgi:glutathione S-transferase